MALLKPGDPFPTVNLQVGEEALALPGALAGDFGVVLFYRGRGRGEGRRIERR